MKQIFSVLLLVLMLMIAGCGTIATPVPPQTALNTSDLFQSSPTPQTPVDPSTVQIGRWVWQSFTTDAETYPPVQLWLDVKEGGQISGTLSVYPNTPDIPESALSLIRQNGCNIPFSSLQDPAVTGIFISVTEAHIQVNITTCAVKFYGDVTLADAVRGRFVAAYDEELTYALLHPLDTPLTPIERGRKIFTTYCSACHGTYGEGAPGIPSLNTDEVRARTDEQVLEIITNGVINTIMPAWGNVLSPEDLQGVLELVRNIEILDA